MRTEAIVESFEASLREAFQQLQGGANAIPWWERKSLAQGMTESFVVGTASETAFLLVALLAKDPKWEVRAAIADLLPVLPEAESKRLTDQLMADSNTYVRRSVERAIERRKREIRAAGKARKSADQVSAQLQAIEDEFGKSAATKSLRMAERYSEMLVASIVHDLRSIMTHLKVNCYSLIEEVIADAGSQAKRYGVRVRNDLQLLESSVEDMVTFTRPVPTERLPERLAVLVAEALELTRDNVRKAKFDPELVAVQQDVPESIVVPRARHQIVIALANVLKNAYEAFQAKGTMRPGAIRIAASTCQKWVTLTIEDTGQGICDEELRTPLLLTPGRRNKSKRQSTGYGLPIAARNVAAHGGLLRLESRENEGTTVTILLPRESQ
jgi:signal transduction histidine kinase